MNLALRLGIGTAIIGAGIGGGIFVLSRANQAPEAGDVASRWLEPVDRNGDDAIDATEAKHAEFGYGFDGEVYSVARSVDATALLAKADANGDDRATRDEIKGWLELHDANHDGLLQYDERTAAREAAGPTIANQVHDW